MPRFALFAWKAQGQGSASPDISEENYMNSVALTLAVRTRLRQKSLPHDAPWRRLGEYAGGGVCAGCGERITSAHASYAVDFTPGVNPQTLRFHRVCFEIWEHECQIPASLPGAPTTDARFPLEQRHT